MGPIPFLLFALFLTLTNPRWCSAERPYKVRSAKLFLASVHVACRRTQPGNPWFGQPREELTELFRSTSLCCVQVKVPV